MLTLCFQKRKGRGGRQQKAPVRELSREEQQRMKELESGLFINEVRISVTVDDDAEEEGVRDILID